LTLEPLRAIADRTEWRESAPGDAIVRHGERGDELILLVEGSARVETDGKILARFSPGETFGEIAVIDGRPRTATVIAETPSRLLVLSRDAFLHLLDTIPGLSRKMLLTVCERLRERTDMLESGRPGLGRRVFTD
jgi:CRP-like cAMP-binding protein